MKDSEIAQKPTTEFKVWQKSSEPKSPPASITAPTHDDIAKRAYAIYVQQGQSQGHCEANWLEAEQDLRHGLALAI